MGLPTSDIVSYTLLFTSISLSDEAVASADRTGLRRKKAYASLSWGKSLVRKAVSIRASLRARVERGGDPQNDVLSLIR